MDCPEAKRGEVEVACPPDDSLVEIFSRLHAKPLFQFKCVSKDWCGLIADRLRCRKLPQTLEGFFCSGSVGNYGDFIDLSGRPVPLVDPSFPFLTKLPEIKKIALLDSCNELVLFGHRRVSDSCYDYDSLGYIVCNPATEEWVSVPSSGWTSWHGSDDEDNQDDDCSATYLVFDPAISPHFQLIRLSMGFLYDLEVVDTFSSVTGAWRHEPNGVPCWALGRTIVDTGACPFHGILHIGVHQRHHPSGNRNMMLAVGGEGRPFRTLHLPENDRGVLVFVGQSQEHLHCLSGCTTEDYQITELSIWVLEDYNAEKWVLRDNVSFSQLFGRMSGHLHSRLECVGHSSRS